MAIAVLIIFVLVLIAGGVALLIIKNRTNKSIQEMKEDNQISEDNDLSPKSTISELPFVDISDSIIDLGKDQYRMVLECSSINLELKTENEQEMVEMSFQRFLQSMNFAFSFYVQTREIDNRVIIENTTRDAEKVVKKYPFLLNYANQYIEGLGNLSETTGNSKFKKKYLIVTYNDINKMENIEDEDKKEIAFKELETRCLTAIYGLQNIGIYSHILNSNEIAEMIFRAYNKEGRALIEGMTSGEMTTLIVDSKKHVNKLSDAATLDLIINEFFKQLETGIINKRGTNDIFKKGASQTIDVVNKLRDNIGGYYKEIPSSDRYGTYEEIMERLHISTDTKELNKSDESIPVIDENDDEIFSL